MFAAKTRKSSTKTPAVSANRSRTQPLPSREHGPNPTHVAGGRPIPSGVWGRSKVPLFSNDRQDIQVRSDAGAINFLRTHQAVAATVDQDTVFVHPAYRDSREVIAHEFAHIAQLRSGRSTSRANAEAEATRVAAGGYFTPAHSVGAAATPMFLSIVEQLTAAKDKNAIFTLLRGLPAGSANTQEVADWLKAHFASAPDDLWLATQLLIQGPEPLWTKESLEQRARLAANSHWPAEAGNIEADLTTASGAGSVRAYLFPGSVPAQRALVFAGVHESEPEGTAVAEALRSRLTTDSAAGRPPAFTTIVVPNLFEDRHLELKFPKVDDRRTIGDIDPNRNFPGDVAPNVRGGSTSKHDEAKPKHKILNENRILMALVERFQPQRVASIHAHSLKAVQGDAAGIFVDPRADPAAGAQDTKLGKDMAQAVAQNLPPATVARVCYEL